MQRLLIIIIAAFCWQIHELKAQQDAQYAQFMYNKLAFNPGFAGAEPSGTFIGIARQQWLGFDEAPSVQSLSYNVPFTANGVGLGLRVNRVSVGLEREYNAEAAYAYRFSLGRGARLGIGLSASVRRFSINFSEATPIQGGGVDQAIPAGDAGKFVPNFGAGIYFDSPSFYFGVSAPRLLENNIDISSDESIISRQVRHFYLMTGLDIKLGEEFVLKPQALFKVVSGAPFDADINLTADLNRNFSLGATYRLGGDDGQGAGESLGALVGFQINDHFRLGMVYEMGLSELRNYHNGSFEGILQYSIGGRAQGEEIVDPRLL
ncbi:MAG: type IX secretion system membrane protein PorP/SprF [Bacteroidota bacterium]